MGWYINLVKNDLIINDGVKAGINALEHWVDPRFSKPINGIGISYEGDKLVFLRRHKEWMDYVWNKEVLKILLDNKVNGEIWFSSSDGDNAGTGWGYRFVDGVMSELTRYDGEYILAADVPKTPPKKRRGKKVTDLAEAKRGDYVAMGFIAFGLTSYEKVVVGDVLPDGVLVVEGYEFMAPNYRHSGEGATRVLKVLSDPSVEL
jgi:hypothetical protein